MKDIYELVKRYWYVRIDDAQDRMLYWTWRILSLDNGPNGWGLRLSHEDVPVLNYRIDGPEVISNPITGMPINVWATSERIVWTAILRYREGTRVELIDDRIHISGAEMVFSMQVEE